MEDEGKKYKVVETMGYIRKDPTSYAYQYSVENLEASELVDGYDFKEDVNKRVKVIILIPEE